MTPSVKKLYIQYAHNTLYNIGVVAIEETALFYIIGDIQLPKTFYSLDCIYIFRDLKICADYTR